METKLPQEAPKLEKLGKLDAIVLQNGRNNSDGNRCAFNQTLVETARCKVRWEPWKVRHKGTSPFHIRNPLFVRKKEQLQGKIESFINSSMN